MDGRLQSGFRGLAPHDGAFRQGSITDWSNELNEIIEPLDLRPRVRVAGTHGFHRGHWINLFGLPSAGCCMTSCHHMRGFLIVLAVLTLAMAALAIVLLERDNPAEQQKVGFRGAASSPPKEALTQTPSGFFSSLPSADAPQSELPAKSARSSMGVALPPAFANSVFNAETEDDPAWLAMQDRITAARDTFSKEGLAILAPMLAHPNARVRAEALDAILQMELPAAGKILRDAARNASSQEYRHTLEQAADFNDLPSISAEQIQKTRPAKKKAPSSNP
jgi:hypothetical protein